MYIHADLSFCSSPFYTCWRDVPTPMALQNGQSESFPLKTNKPESSKPRSKRVESKFAPLQNPVQEVNHYKDLKGCPAPWIPHILENEVPGMPTTKTDSRAAGWLKCILGKTICKSQACLWIEIWLVWTCIKQFPVKNEMLNLHDQSCRMYSILNADRPSINRISQSCSTAMSTLLTWSNGRQQQSQTQGYILNHCKKCKQTPTRNLNIIAESAKATATLELCLVNPTTRIDLGISTKGKSLQGR